LRPTISICLLNQVLFEGVEDYHLAFGLYNTEHGLRFSDHIELHVLELAKFDRELEELREPLEKWVYFLQHAATMDVEALPAPFREPVYQRTMKELEMLTKDFIEWERYESRQKAARDQMSLLEGALEQGLEEGRLMERVQLCQQLLHLPVTPQDELLRLPSEELRALAETLKAELANR